MTMFDWILLAFIALMAWQGARAGFIGGALSLVGFVVGALLAARLAPLLLPSGAKSPYAPLIALFGAALGGMALSVLLQGLGDGIRRMLPAPFLGTVDRGFGLVLVGLAVVWLAAIVVVQLPVTASVRREIRSSKVVSAIVGVAPSTGDLLGAVQAIDPLPSINGLSAGLLAAPQSGLGSLPAVRAAGRSVVKVRALSCGFAVEGSGWVAAPGLVVTNAHVVAGDGNPTVEAFGEDGPLQGTVLQFNRSDDVAIVSVPGLRASPLRVIAVPESGTPAEVLGFPLDGPLRGSAARVGSTVSSLSDDAYGQGPVRRTLTILRGRVRPGNSGGPLVDDAGNVIGTVFGRTTDGGPAGGFAVPSGPVLSALRRANSGQRDPVGPCGH